MSKEKVDVMVEGGAATSGPQMGQSLGPLKINIQDVIKKINEKTIDFKGMKVPVSIIVDTETKQFDLVVGTPPTSELIKKELGIKKGSGSAGTISYGVLGIEQVIKITKMKRDSIMGKNFKSKVKTVVGSCGAMGVEIEGKNYKEINKLIDDGVYDDLIYKEKTDLSEDKIKSLKEKNKEIQIKIKEVEAAKEAAKETKTEEKKQN